MNPKLAIVLGIRPDVIRASLVLEKLRVQKDLELCFIWTGQHYSDNLKDIFFRELHVQAPDKELGATGKTDAEIVASVVSRLHPVLEDLKPVATVFLGDTNSVMGCLASAQLNIPIVHIEGCMRSYDWRMPEEKYRSTIDHLSDVIYAYFPEYKEQGVREGLNPDNIVVIGNLIVDVLQKHYFEQKSKFETMAKPSFFQERGIERERYFLMTCHRRENVHEIASLKAVLNLVGQAQYLVYFPASYRTQHVIREQGIVIPKNVKMVDPIGYQEFLCLIVNSRGVFTDSGTVVEETCILQIPSVQMRRSTERPQVYDAGSSVKFDPAAPQDFPIDRVLAKLESLYKKTWKHNLGDGKASERIVEDLRLRIHGNGFARHRPECYHLPIKRSYQGDGLK